MTTTHRFDLEQQTPDQLRILRSLMHAVTGSADAWQGVNRELPLNYTTDVPVPNAKPGGLLPTIYSRLVWWEYADRTQSRSRSQQRSGIIPEWMRQAVETMKDPADLEAALQANLGTSRPAVDDDEPPTQMRRR